MRQQPPKQHNSHKTQPTVHKLPPHIATNQSRPYQTIPDHTRPESPESPNQAIHLTSRKRPKPTSSSIRPFTFQPLKQTKPADHKLQTLQTSQTTANHKLQTTQTSRLFPFIQPLHSVSYTQPPPSSSPLPEHIYQPAQTKNGKRKTEIHHHTTNERRSARGGVLY